jgi:hypothetical protein
MGEMAKLVAGFTLLLVAMLALGCGGGDSSTVSQTAEKQQLYPWLKGPSREFLIRNGDNAVQTYGREATGAERAQASDVIEAWMKARAAQNWAKDCSYFARKYVHTLVATDAVQVSEGKVKNCPQALAYFGHLASGSYKNNLTGPIDSLRVKGGLGYAQYHGNDGHDWVITMEREDGKWWIANSTPLGRSS